MFHFREECPIKDGRQLAFEVLVKMLRDGSYSNLALNAALRKNQMNPADRALCTELVYGTTERRLTLDDQLSRCLRQPLRKLKPNVHAALLLGSYQILFLDRIPDHAAVNESVRLVRKNGAAYAAGLVNAVLRKIAAEGLVLPDSSHPLHRLSVQYSCPEELVQLFVRTYGEEAAVGILEHGLGAESLTIRVNTCRTDSASLRRILAEEGVASEPHPLVEDALVLKKAGSVERLQSFQDGLFHVQDASSQLCCARMDPQPGETVFDVCAAPGGKSFTLAERMQDRGTVCAFDLYEQRTGLIRDGAARLGLQSISARCADAEVFDADRGLADRVLCDVPCSGLGILGRKPEIRYKALREIDNLPSLQYHILCISSQYCRVGGRLVYSTCSLHPAENGGVVEHFLQEHSDYSLVSQETLLPGSHHCDGFFIAVLERLGESA